MVRETLTENQTGYAPTGFCGGGCSREGKLRTVATVYLDGREMKIPMYRCKWHEAAFRRWSNKMKRLP